MYRDGNEWKENWFNLPTDYEKSTGFYIIRGGKNIAEQGYHFSKPVYQRSSVHFILEGSVLFTQNGKTHRLDAKSIFFPFPQCKHEYKINPDCTSNLRMYWITFDGANISHVWDRIGLKPDVPFLSKKLDY